MNENLSEMVRESSTEEEEVFYSDDLEEIKADEQKSEEVNVSQQGQEPTSASDRLPITNLATWFDNNITYFPNIRKPTVQIQGVDPTDQVIITIGVPNSDKRRLIVFDNSSEIPVLNMPAVDMQVYNNNAFRIIYEYKDGIYIKVYGVRTGLITTFCVDVEDVLVPYMVVKSKKHETEVEVPTTDAEFVKGKLHEELDFEALQLRYRQSSKAEGLETNLDAVKWLVEKQGMLYDINHHIQIDNVIIDTLTP